MAVVAAPNGLDADVDHPRLPPPVPRDDWKSVRFLVATFYHSVVRGQYRQMQEMVSLLLLICFCGFMDFNNESVHG